MAFNHRNARMADFHLTVPPYEKSSVSIIESAFMKELRKESIKNIDHSGGNDIMLAPEEDKNDGRDKKRDHQRGKGRTWDRI